MTVHLLGLPQTETTREYEFCAFTAKTRKLATMLTSLGIPVVLYAGEANEADVAEHVPIVTRADQEGWFPGWDHKLHVFNGYDTLSPWWQAFNARAAAAIAERIQPGDIVGVTMGVAQQPAIAALARSDVLVVEVGVGYSGVFAPYRVFESWAWRSYLASKEPSDDVRFFDEVIPNFFEADAFPAGAGDGGYYLFVGRMIRRKGIHIAAEACRRLGARLLFAGQGVTSSRPGRIETIDGTVLEGDVEYVGVIGPEERARLMGGAIATFAPTVYLEPFGGVSVEAQMTGTPAIVSPAGGLPENVIHGRTGFVCSTLAQFADAALAARDLDRAAIRERAVATWSTDVLRHRYAAYFDRLGTLFGDGWYAAA